MNAQQKLEQIKANLENILSLSDGELLQLGLVSGYDYSLIVKVKDRLDNKLARMQEKSK